MSRTHRILVVDDDPGLRRTLARILEPPTGSRRSPGRGRPWRGSRPGSTLGAAWRRGADPERVGRELLAGIDFLEGATCATLVYALLLPDGRVRLWSAGHPSLLLLRGLRAKGAGEIQPIGSTGPLLHSLFRDRPPATREVTLGPGDRLLALTDGAFEVRNPADQELGLPRLEAAFAALRDRPAGETLDALLDEVLAHGAGRPVADDVTLVLIERTGSSSRFASPS